MIVACVWVISRHHPDIRPDCRALPGLRGLVHVEYSVRDRFPKVATWEDPSPKIRKPASLLGNNVGIDPRYLTGVTTILNLSLSVSRSEP